MCFEKGLSNKDEIIRIKHQIYTSSEPVIQTIAIDTLATYGEQAINEISEVINLSDINLRVREYGLQIIEDIKRYN